METVEKKGITTKVDVELHAKAKQYMAEHGDMNMETFITQAINGLVNAKEQAQETQKPEKQRTIAFQVPESFYNEVKDYLERNGLRQNRFMYNLIKQELDREELEMERLAQKQNGDQSDETPDDSEDEDESQAEREDSYDDGEDEDEAEGMAMMQ
jgi:ferredoxin-NADP reductase